jgi:hypothetical protein
MKILKLRSFGARGTLALSYMLVIIPVLAAADALIAAVRKEGAVTWNSSFRRPARLDPWSD